MKNDSSQVGFALQGIKTEQFALFEDNYSPQKEVGLGTALQFKLDQTNKQIGSYLAFEFIQAKKIILKLAISCHFKIQDESWQSFIQAEAHTLVIPKGFLAHLAMITTGTSRGILFAKTESTVFSKFIVPVLNVAEMIPEDVSFDFAKD